MTEFVDHCLIFIQHQNMFKKGFVRAEKVGDNICAVIFTDKTIEYICQEELPFSEGQSIVCENTKENVDKLIERWKEYANNPQITITFFDVNKGTRWSIKPYIHAKISQNIAPGILSLFQNSLA